MSDESYRTTLSEWLSTPVENTRYKSKRNFGSGPSGKTSTFTKRGWKNLTHDVSEGFKTSSAGVNQRLRFANQAVSEAASDDFLATHQISEEIFTEILDGGNSKMVAKVEYAPSRLLMRVTFVEHGAVVLYDHVPASVFADLKYTADSGRSLGGRFWDLVREGMRGGLQVGGPYYPKLSTFTREDSKYPYHTLTEYEATPRSTEYRVQQENPSTGAVQKMTRTEANKAVERSIDQQILQMRRSGRPITVADDERLRLAREKTEQIKKERAARSVKSPRFLGFRQNFLVDDDNMTDEERRRLLEED